MAPAGASEAYSESENYSMKDTLLCQPVKVRPSIRCQWFLQGTCRYGNDCRYVHEAANISEAATTPDITQTTCNICLEPINLFAILSGCDHAFCMPCMHKWRSEASNQMTQEGVKSNRSCPMCRTHSEFILPSPIFVEKEEKTQLIASMMAARAKKPCNEWVKSKKCKFGGNCFYAHLDGNGVDMKPRQLEELKNRPKRSAFLGSHRDISFDRAYRDLLNTFRSLNMTLDRTGGRRSDFNHDWDSEDEWEDMDDEDDYFQFHTAY
jgi:hypothetical protein